MDELFKVPYTSIMKFHLELLHLVTTTYATSNSTHDTKLSYNIDIGCSFQAQMNHLTKKKEH